MNIRRVIYIDQYGAETEPVFQIKTKGKWVNIEDKVIKLDIDYGNDNKSKNINLELIRKKIL